MPKVSQEYIDNKRKAITDAAHRVALRKPVMMITMTDIIEETGMAQGGIYRYFTDLDDILVSLIRDMRTSYSIYDETDEIFADAENMGYEEMVEAIFDLLADRMSRTIDDIMKIDFDLTVMAMNDPDRVKRIIGNINSEGNIEHLVRLSFEQIGKKLKDSGYTPLLPAEDVIKFVSASYSGIQMSCILSHCYGYGKQGISYEVKPLMNALAKTMIMLMGGKV